AYGAFLINMDCWRRCSQQRATWCLRAIRKETFSRLMGAPARDSGIFKPEQDIEVPQSHIPSTAANTSRRRRDGSSRLRAECLAAYFQVLVKPGESGQRSSCSLCPKGQDENQQEVLKRGEEVFAQSCTGYCHATKGGGGGGAPRLAARGFDQSYINNIVTRGIPGTAMSAFGMTLSRVDLTAIVAYVATLNGI